jgi:uncharacterized Ntn-hydrolase superfamily protein
MSNALLVFSMIGLIIRSNAMKRRKPFYPRVLTFLAIIMLCFPLLAQATFSIVAVDTLTGEVGGAGASCINDSYIINDLIESVGAVHTQAWWLQANKDNAHNLLAAGLTPDSIIGWLVNNDVEGQPELRQYGVVTLAGSGASAAYTGSSTDSWAGHITGPGYAIQGNILLGPEIVQNMETAFLTTDGPIEARLMAALQAANVPGADTRCLPNNKPALSAFIRVLRPGDGDNHYLDIVVASAPGTINPIDRVQYFYDSWKATQIADPDLSSAAVNPTYLPALGEDSAVITVTPRNGDGDPPSDGALVSFWNTGEGTISEATDNGDGTFTSYILAPALPGYDTVHPAVIAGGETIYLSQHPSLIYYLCGDANLDQTTNVADAVYLINWIFKGGPAPVPLEAGDANCDSQTNVGDAVYLINYVFKSGPPPCCP